MPIKATAPIQLGTGDRLQIPRVTIGHWIATEVVSLPPIYAWRLLPRVEYVPPSLHLSGSCRDDEPVPGLTGTSHQARQLQVQEVQAHLANRKESSHHQIKRGSHLTNSWQEVDPVGAGGWPRLLLLLAALEVRHPVVGLVAALLLAEHAAHPGQEEGGRGV